jgi:hypothetical protein
VRGLFETKSNNLLVSKVRTRRCLMKELNYSSCRVGSGRVNRGGRLFVCILHHKLAIPFSIDIGTGNILYFTDSFVSL